MKYDELLKKLNSHFKHSHFKVVCALKGWELQRMVDKKTSSVIIYNHLEPMAIHIWGIIQGIELKEYDNQLPFSPTAKPANTNLEKFIAQKIAEDFIPTDKYIRENFVTGDGVENRSKPFNMPNDRPIPKDRPKNSSN